ncbi:hypothetical protein MKK64_20250 [Methylobacterium sp. E-025]|nr:hypothetical protein [Methylobacterium sp. E-025]MCJ2113505.1 hypothetical protein [Methylobacterium sp. E-025]
MPVADDADHLEFGFDERQMEPMIRWRSERDVQSGIEHGHHGVVVEVRDGGVAARVGIAQFGLPRRDLPSECVEPFATEGVGAAPPRFIRGELAMAERRDQTLKNRVVEVREFRLSAEADGASPSGRARPPRHPAGGPDRVPRPRRGCRG